MKRYQVADLQGALLDAAVAKADGLPWIIEVVAIATPDPVRHMTCWLKGPVGRPDMAAGPYAPSSNWAQGGPIIDRERIELMDDAPIGWSAAMKPGYGQGSCALEAAMRAYVNSKFGDDVEL